MNGDHAAFNAFNGGHWIPIKDGDLRAYALYQRHYSAHHYKTKRKRLFAGPGFKLCLMTVYCDALFVWRKFKSLDTQTGISCAVFRNESDVLSSELIAEAMQRAWLRWPGERLYTYVNAAKVQSKNPGYCFKVAGWKQCGLTQKRLLIFEAQA